MNRLWTIAAREYLAYVRTVGFWLSMLLMPVGLTLGGLLPSIMERSAAETTLAIVDLTGRGYADRIEALIGDGEARNAALALRAAATAAAGPEAGESVYRAFEQGGEKAARARFSEVAPRAGSGFPALSSAFNFAPPPAEALKAGTSAAAAAVLRPYVSGERVLPDGTRLTAAAIIHGGSGGAPSLDFWADNIANDTTQNRVQNALDRIVRDDALKALGVDVAALEDLERRQIVVRTFSPRAETGEVSLRDRLPAIVGFAMGFLLWSVVLTGAGILLNSVIEEKSSRILEVLLASASTVEIMGGKILGVAMVTLTVLGVWGGLAVLLLGSGAPGLSEDLAAVLIGRGLLPYFALYLIGGYLMYAALFSALGAFCETTREAQTLLGPLMLLLTVPILFMSVALRNPEAEILRILSWIPPFTPFIMAARAGGQPAWWEIAGTASVMAVTVALVLWLSGRAFRAGALSTVKLEPRALLALIRKR